MKSLRSFAASGMLALVAAAGSVLACGTPPEPPPPPPAPPIVCCQVVSWFIDPANPNRECIIVRYFRQDGLPLFVSNTMPVTGTQQCACGVPSLPPIPGLMDMGLSFGLNFEPCGQLPTNAPGYNTFGPGSDPFVGQAVESFFDIFNSVAGIPNPNPGTARISTVWSFSGPGFIPPNVRFDVYRKLCFPRGFDPRQLCPPDSLSSLGLFLVDGQQVFIEPGFPGGPAIPVGQWKPNVPVAAYKVKCLPFPFVEPCNPCPPPPSPCPGDANGDNVVNFADISATLAAFGRICPP